MNQIKKLEEDFHRVQEILDRAKAGLMELEPEMESLEAAIDGREGQLHGDQKDHAGWFSFLAQKS